MNRLILGDCVRELRKFKDKSIDVIFADPPYGIGLKYRGYVDSQENLKRLVAEVMPELLRIGHRVLVTPGIINLGFYPQPTWQLAWVYHGVNYCKWGFNCWQPVLAYGKDPYFANRMGGRPDVIYINAGRRDPMAARHPCPKPLPFMLKLLARVSVKESDIILDPFCGSGTTLVAAKMMGRRYIGIERDRSYLEIARARLKAVR